MGKHKRRIRTYEPGAHVVLRTENGYRRAIIVQDNGKNEPMVKVRRTIDGLVEDRWVFRVDLKLP